MRVIAAPVAEGWYQALVVAVVKKDTRKGRIPFLSCRITSGKNEGRKVNFLVPPLVKEGTHFHRLLVSVLGSLDVEKEMDPQVLQVLVDRTVAIRVKRVRRGKWTYANVVAMSPPEEVGEGTRKTGHRRGQSAARE